MEPQAAPTVEELWQILQEQREENREYAARVEALEASLNDRECEAKEDARTLRPRRSPVSRVSRAGLLKAGAASVAALAATEIAGSLGAPAAEASASYAAGTFYADGESGATVGFKTGTYTTDFYGYAEGVLAYGQNTAVVAYGVDSTGSLNYAGGVYGETASGFGVKGVCHTLSGVGVFGTSEGGGGGYDSFGVLGQSYTGAAGVGGISASGVGVLGQITGSPYPPDGTNVAVYGTGAGPSGSPLGKIGVQGVSDTNTGVLGTSGSGYGMEGNSSSAIGVLGQVSGSQLPAYGTNVAIYGTGAGGPGSPLGKVGVQGVSDTNSGVFGSSTGGYGVRGLSASSVGVYGSSSTSFGVEGVSSRSYGGVFASTEGTGLIAEQISTLTASTGASCLYALRIGTNATNNAYNYTGPLIYGNDRPTNSGGGMTPQSTGPLLQLDKNGSTKLKVDGSGNLTLGGSVMLTPTTAATATDGSITPPAQVAGYLVISIGGTQYKLPYYNS